MSDATLPSAIHAESDLESQASIDRLSRRLFLIFLIPLLVILVLGVYTIYLSRRLGEVEQNARALGILEEMNVIERYIDKNRDYAWGTAEYERLAKISPNARVLSRLAGLYVGSGKFDEALRTLEMAKREDPKYWEIYSVEMVLYYRRGEAAKAIAAGEKAVDYNPLDTQSLNNLAWLYATSDATLQNSERALDYASKAVSYSRRKSIDYLDTLAEVHWSRGETKKAIEIVDNAIARQGSELRDLTEHRRKFLRQTTGGAR